MDKTQTELIGLLKEIDDICRNHGITYFLDGGTMLGAVRHDGFIPWDNDADIAMTEENYRKFAEVVNATTETTNRCVMDNRINREYPLEIGRYLNLDMTKITSTSPWWNVEKPYAGLMIDIFQMIPLPKNPHKKKLMMDRFCAYAEFSNESNRRSGRRTEQSIAIYKRAKLAARFVGKERVLRWFERKIFNQGLTDFDEYMYVQSGRKIPRVFPREHFDSEPVRKPFEGMMLPVSRYYHEEARVFFDDDYWRIPGQEGQLVHAPINNANIPCRLYVKDYMRFLDPEVVKETRLEAKESHVKEGVLRQKASVALCIRRIELACAALYSRLEKEQIDLIEELNKENYVLLNELFDTYFKEQFRDQAKYWPEIVEMREDAIYTAIMILINDRGDYGKASWLLRSYKENIHNVPESLNKIQELLDCVFYARSRFDYGEYEKGSRFIRNGLAMFPNNRELRIWDLRYRVQLSEENDSTLLMHEADKLALEFPDSEYPTKIKGDILWKKGAKDDAMKLYESIYESSRDGMLRLDVERKRGQTRE